MGSVFSLSRHASVLWWLAGLNLAVFVVINLISYSVPDAVLYLSLPGNIDAWLSRPWTILTYMVTQVEFLHLLFNMLTLLWFGSLLLMEISERRLLILYIGGGLLGALFYLGGTVAFGGGGIPLLMGSSASVLALMTAAAFLLGNMRLHLFFMGDVKLKWIVLFMIVLSFLNLGGGAAWGLLAHIGGALFGVLYVFRKSSYNVSSVEKAPKHRQPTKAGARRVASILEQNRLDKQRMDELLDKIKVSGYDSLSRSERAELDDISRRISK